LSKELRSMDDEQLMDEFNQCSDRAVLVLIERHKDSLFRHIYYFLGIEPERARDVIPQLWNDTNSRLFTRKGRYKPRDKAKFSTYYFKIARNLSLNYLRDQKRRARLFDSNVEIGLSGDPMDSGSKWYDPPDDDVSIDEALDSGMPLERFSKAYRKLTDREQFMLQLYYFEDLTYKEIARLTGVKNTTCRSHVHRARAKLRKMMGRS